MNTVNLLAYSRRSVLVSKVLRNNIKAARLCSTNLPAITRNPCFLGCAKSHKLNLNPYHCLTAFVRNYKGAPSSREENLRQVDGLPTNYRLIYKAPMDRYVKVARSFSAVTSVALFCAGIYASSSGTWDVQPFETDGILQAFVRSNEDLAMVIVGFLLLNVSIQYIASQYVLRIYYNGLNSYTCIFASYLPWTTIKLTFEAGQVKYIGRQGILPWQESKYIIGNRNVLLLEDYFRTPADRETMLKPKPIKK